LPDADVERSEHSETKVSQPSAGSGVQTPRVGSNPSGLRECRPHLRII
jgi:hypothetical protein